MEAWSRFRDSFSSLPSTSPSSSASSSSASLQPSLLLDAADELWFYRSVVPLPSFSLPCLPSLLSSSPDPSTLIAQCMITNFSPASERPRPAVSSSSSSSPPVPPSDLQPKTHASPFLPAFDAYPAPPSIKEIYANTFSEYEDETDSSSTESEEDEDAYRGYPHASVADDEEAYYYYTAPSDWDDDDAHHGYNVPSDGEGQQQVHAVKEEVLHADAALRRARFEPDDALSGIYGVGSLLKDQPQKRTREVSYSRHQREAAFRGSYRLRNRAQARNEQKEVKENLKLWAHMVVSTLATQARPLL